MNFFRKLTLAGVGLAFVLGLAVTDSFGQRNGRSYGNRGYSSRVYVQYGQYQPRYNSYYGNRRSRRSYNSRGGYGYVSSRERRKLQRQRYRMIRAQNRYYRTRARVANRAYNRRNAYTYRNW